LACYVRMMCQEDVDQVTEIDREAFPTQWPSSNYKRELRNRLAHYIVACDGDRLAEQPETGTRRDKSPGLLARLKKMFGGGSPSGDGQPPPDEHCIVGFVGLWIMADEAHITSIAVRESRRREGIGELLMVSAIDIARELKANIVTLEARVSNTGAHQLYSRYGFNKVGIRKGYYTDNREDAVVMSTDSITSPAYRMQLRELKKALSKKLGVTLRKVQR
jgi:ribosomal-protein-alanine N-acetyltransferase